MNRIIVLSDIHANLSALRAVLADIKSKQYEPDVVVLLGDIINYGMRPNEVIEELKNLPYPVEINLLGNHEKALLDGEVNHFSTERGKRLLQYTSSVLTDASLKYIREKMNSTAYETKKWCDRQFLFIHGNKDDAFWGKLSVDKMADSYYSKYDFVISGHTHLPHYLEYYYSVDCPHLRNKKKTIFINPGSVGQPRNQNPYAQYVFLELSSGTVHHNAVSYDVETEYQLYPPFLDSFYKERLILGI